MTKTPTGIHHGSDIHNRILFFIISNSNLYWFFTLKSIFQKSYLYQTNADTKISVKIENI